MEGYLLIGEKAETETEPGYTRKYFRDLPFAPVLMLSEVRLTPGSSFRTPPSGPAVIIPVRGALETDPENVLVPGEAGYLAQPAY
ncbi:MAG: hypothetical protein LRY55_08530, partial [Leadbetterella sp.]|nr:hypothetical protein [Leadbetterella sp.]